MAGEPVPVVQAPTISGDSIGLLAPPDVPPGPAADTLPLVDLRGAPVLLNLWATWCPPCREETPYLASLQERYAEEGLRVVGVTVDGAGSLRQVRDFLQEAGAEYTQLHDPRMSTMDQFGVLGLPATFLVDRDGTLRLARIGPVSDADTTFVRALESLLEG